MPTYSTDHYEGMLAETVTLTGAGGDPIQAVLARADAGGFLPAD